MSDPSKPNLTIGPQAARSAPQTRISRGTQIMQGLSLSTLVKDEAPRIHGLLADIGQFLLGAAIVVGIGWFGPRNAWPKAWVAGGIAFGVIVAIPQIVRSSLSVVGSVLDLVNKARGGQ